MKNAQQSSENEQSLPPALVYTADQVCSALQISPVTLWRLEKRGLLRSLPHFRHRRYPVKAVEKLASSIQ